MILIGGAGIEKFLHAPLLLPIGSKRGAYSKAIKFYHCWIILHMLLVIVDENKKLTFLCQLVRVLVLTKLIALTEENI